MLVKKEDSKQVSNSDKCTVWEYDTKTKNFNVATAFIDGRFPDEKRVVNLELEEIYYVQSGSATIHSEKGEFVIVEGDVYLFDKIFNAANVIFSNSFRVNLLFEIHKKEKKQ